MIGDAGLGAPAAPDASWQPFADAEVYPNLEHVTFVARAISRRRAAPSVSTPAFFLADMAAVTHVKPDVVGPSSELVEMVHGQLRRSPQARFGRRLPMP